MGEGEVGAQGVVDSGGGGCADGRELVGGVGGGGDDAEGLGGRGLVGCSCGLMGVDGVGLPSLLGLDGVVCVCLSAMRLGLSAQMVFRWSRWQ